LDVNTFPLVPALDTPVPPFAGGRMPVTLVAKLANVVDVEPVPPLAMGSVPFTSPARSIFVTVLLSPLIVLFVSVAVLLSVSTFVGVMIPDSVAMFYSGVLTFCSSKLRFRFQQHALRAEI
jgi:hypothetical protein